MELFDRLNELFRSDFIRLALMLFVVSALLRMLVKLWAWRASKRGELDMTKFHFIATVRGTVSSSGSRSWLAKMQVFGGEDCVAIVWGQGIYILTFGEPAPRGQWWRRLYSTRLQLETVVQAEGALTFNTKGFDHWKFTLPLTPEEMKAVEEALAPDPVLLAAEQRFDTIVWRG